MLRILSVPALALLVLPVVWWTLPPLGTAVYLNLAYLELARRTPAPEQARELVERAQEINPDAPGVVRALGLLALGDGDALQAYALLKLAAANEGSDALTHWRLGQALEASGDQEAAAYEFRLAGAAPFFVNAALQARHQKDWRGAEQYYLRALDIDQNPTVTRNLAEFYRDWRKPDRARVYLLRALELEQREYERALVRGELADLAGDDAGAEREFQSAIHQNPGNPEAYRLLAEMYLARGERTAALDILETGAINAAPAFGLALRLAQVHIELRSWNAAERALARAKLEQGTSDEVELVRAQLEFARANPAAAVTALEHALTLAPYNAETHFWLGRALVQLGQCDVAREAYARATALAPDDARFTSEQQEWGGCK